jgi:hypothetical protein
MAEQDWLTPATAPAPSPYANVMEVPRMSAPAYELRPLTLGELLDRTFSLYRSRFWLFAGIATVSGAVYLVANVAQLVANHFLWRHNTSATASFGRGAMSLVVLAVYFLAFSVTQAAITFALSEVYLGKTATIGSSLKATAARWYVYAAIALWQGWSMVWLPVVLLVPAMIAVSMRLPALMVFGGLLMFVGIVGGTVFGVIAYLRNGLAVQAAVLEHLKIRPSMRRSKDLTKGAKWRTFVVYLVATALYMVFGVLQLPLFFLIAETLRKGGEAIGAQAAVLLIGFLGHALVSPVVLIGCSLVYFDQRVRKEAFDIAFLLGEPGPESFPAGFDGGIAATEVPPADAAVAEVSGEPRESDAKAPDDLGV